MIGRIHEIHIFQLYNLLCSTKILGNFTNCISVYGIEVRNEHYDCTLTSKFNFKCKVKQKGWDLFKGSGVSSLLKSGVVNYYVLTIISVTFNFSVSWHIKGLWLMHSLRFYKDSEEKKGCIFQNSTWSSTWYEIHTLSTGLAQGHLLVFLSRYFPTTVPELLFWPIVYRLTVTTKWDC